MNSLEALPQMKVKCHDRSTAFSIGYWFVCRVVQHAKANSGEKG